MGNYMANWIEQFTIYLVVSISMTMMKIRCNKPLIRLLNAVEMEFIRCRYKYFNEKLHLFFHEKWKKKKLWKIWCILYWIRSCSEHKGIFSSNVNLMAIFKYFSLNFEVLNSIRNWTSFLLLHNVNWIFRCKHLIAFVCAFTSCRHPLAFVCEFKMKKKQINSNAISIFCLYCMNESDTSR